LLNIIENPPTLYRVPPRTFTRFKTEDILYGNWKQLKNESKRSSGGTTIRNKEEQQHECDATTPQAKLRT
jgi:hypothetical protein